MAYRGRYPVRFGDIDHAGIVFYPSLLRLVHEAFEDTWRVALGTPYPEVCDRHHLGLPTVHLEADFRAPLRYGDEVEVAVWVAAVGTKSVTWRYVLTRRADGVRCAEVTVKTVAVDLRTFRGIPVPGWARELLGTLGEQG